MENTHRIEGPEAIFAWSWQLVKANWKKLFTIAVVPVAFGYIGNLLVALDPKLGILSALCYLAAVVFGVAMVPSMIYSIDSIAGGTDAGLSWWQKYRRGFKIFWPMLLVMVIAVLNFIGSIALFIIPGIIVVFYMILYIYTITLDGKRGFEAFKYSFTLVRGRWWAVAVRVVFMAIVCEIFYVVTLIIGGIISVIFTAIGAPVLAPIIMAIVAIIAVPVLLMFSYSYQYRLYKVLKTYPLPENGKEKTFKGWIIAFTILGIIIPIVAIIGVVSLLSNVKRLPNEFMPNYGMQLPLMNIETPNK